MNVTGHGEEGRKLHKEDYPQKVQVEPEEYVEVPDRGKMAENITSNTSNRKLV